MLVKILCAVAAFAAAASAQPQVDAAKSAAATAEIRRLTQSLELYHLDVGRYPTTAEGLEALVTPPTPPGNWAGPYVTRLAADPWGQPFVYRAPTAEGGFELFSRGPRLAPSSLPH